MRAIGETGLDYYRTGEAGRPQQEESFRRHIALAKATGKALVIHDRDAHDDVLRVLDDEGAPERVVLHCFSGGADFARECVARGFVLSFAGNVTFKNAGQLRDAARRHAARPAAGRDRRAVPHAGAVPRPAQRAEPDPADGAGDGGAEGGRRTTSSRQR